MLRKIIRYKVYYDRGGMLFNYLRTFVLIAVSYKIFEDSAIGMWMAKHASVVIPITLFCYISCRVVLGRIDFKKKIREYEIAEYNKTDPNLRFIQKSLKTIIDKLNDKGN